MKNCFLACVSVRKECSFFVLNILLHFHSLSELLNHCLPVVIGLLSHVLTFLDTWAFFKGHRLLTVLNQLHSVVSHRILITQFEWMAGAHSLGVKQLGHEAVSSPLSVFKNSRDLHDSFIHFRSVRILSGQCHMNELFI